MVRVGTEFVKISRRHETQDAHLTFPALQSRLMNAGC